MNFASTILVAFLAIVATPQQSQPDVKGSSDHPLLPNRMPGYRISSYEKQDFKSHKFLTDPQQVIDGKYTEIRYELKDKTKDPGPLTVRRFYENAVKSAGGQILPLLLDSSREYRNAMKITRNGVEVWVELNTYVKPDYILYIVERAPMKKMATADTSVDVKGSADHPLFSGRMPGYRISAYEQQDFKSHKFLADPQQVIDGKYTEIRYELKDRTKDPGPLTVRRFYENAVKSAGGQILPLLLDSSREYRNAMKITRNGVEMWVELNTYVKPDYILYIVERAPMKH